VVDKLSVCSLYNINNYLLDITYIYETEIIITVLVFIITLYIYYNKNGYKLKVDCSSSKRSVSIRFRLAIRVNNLIGKGSPCRGDRCRVEAGLTR